MHIFQIWQLFNTHRISGIINMSKMNEITSSSIMQRQYSHKKAIMEVRATILLHWSETAFLQQVSRSNNPEKER